MTIEEARVQREKVLKRLQGKRLDEGHVPIRDFLITPIGDVISLKEVINRYRTYRQIEFTTSDTLEYELLTVYESNKASVDLWEKTAKTLKKFDHLP